MNKQELQEKANKLSDQLARQQSIVSFPGVHIESYLDLDKSYIPLDILQKRIIPFLEYNNGYISVNPDRSKHSICLFFKN